MSHNNNITPFGFSPVVKQPVVIKPMQQQLKQQLPPQLQAAVDKAKANQDAQAIVKQVPVKGRLPPKAPTPNVPLHFNVDKVPKKDSLKSRKDDKKVAEQLENYRQKSLAQQKNAIERKLTSMTSDKLPMTLNVGNLDSDQKTSLIAQLKEKGYNVDESKQTKRHAQRKAESNQAASERATARAAKKTERAAKNAERAKNPKNAQDASKENTADAAAVSKKKNAQKPENAIKPNAAGDSKFPKTRKVDNIVIN